MEIYFKNSVKEQAKRLEKWYKETYYEHDIRNKED